jgi:hypothetical protein
MHLLLLEVLFLELEFIFEAVHLVIHLIDYIVIACSLFSLIKSHALRELILECIVIHLVMLLRSFYMKLLLLSPHSL